MSTPKDCLCNSHSITTHGVDMEKSKAKYEKDSKHYLDMGKFKIDGKTQKLILEGELTTNGIAENKWTNDNKTSTTLSLGLALCDEDITFFEKVQDVLANFVGEEYELTTLVKNDIIYFKIKDKKVFNAMANVKADTLFHGQKFKVTLDLKFYINLKEEKAGVVLHPVKYEFFKESD